MQVWNGGVAISARGLVRDRGGDEAPPSMGEKKREDFAARLEAGQEV
jgi:hypothetical protein